MKYLKPLRRIAVFAALGLWALMPYTASAADETINSQVARQKEVDNPSAARSEHHPPPLGREREDL